MIPEDLKLGMYIEIEYINLFKKKRKIRGYVVTLNISRDDYYIELNKKLRNSFLDFFNGHDFECSKIDFEKNKINIVELKWA